MYAFDHRGRGMLSSTCVLACLTMTAFGAVAHAAVVTDALDLVPDNMLNVGRSAIPSQDRAQLPISAEENDRPGHPPDSSDPSPRAVGCLNCHGDLEDITANMNWGGGSNQCTRCHGGDSHATTKEQAHVQPTLPVIMDKTVVPLDYDLPYQRFVNPSDLRVVNETCGDCHTHQDETEVIFKGLMATAAGHYAGGLYLNGVTNTKTPIYGTFAVTDDDGYVPTEQGAVASLLDLITYDPAGDPTLFATHYRAVPGQACARCHLWSRGKGYRGAVEADGVYRADGCAACHMVYANDGLSTSADTSIDHNQPGHPMVHVITAAIPTEQCLHCHHRGARIGLSFTGRAQMPPRLPSGPGVPGTTDVVFNGNYHYTDSETNPPDVHHERGLHCIDCHTKNGVMGDGNIFGHMDQATQIRCQTCHGVLTAEGTLIDEDGLDLNNVTQNPGGSIVLTSKITGQQHTVPQVTDIVDPASPVYSSHAACAMNDTHIKEQGGLECYACHTSWTPNCFGCHFERDERFTGLNLVTRQEEIGRARTNNKIFESLKHFSMGKNPKGRLPAGRRRHRARRKQDPGLRDAHHRQPAFRSRPRAGESAYGPCGGRGANLRRVSPVATVVGPGLGQLCAGPHTRLCGYGRWCAGLRSTY